MAIQIVVLNIVNIKGGLKSDCDLKVFTSTTSRD